MVRHQLDRIPACGPRGKLPAGRQGSLHWNDASQRRKRRTRVTTIIPPRSPHPSVLASCSSGHRGSSVQCLKEKWQHVCLQYLGIAFVIQSSIDLRRPCDRQGENPVALDTCGRRRRGTAPPALAAASVPFSGMSVAHVFAQVTDYGPQSAWQANNTVLEGSHLATASCAWLAAVHTRPTKS